ncbi:tRNA threonylcarbamoyladenosine dehydratase [Paramaledivibacter caminithermalis]|jgi:tRNA A37 threonylcarbamoyladenosine dehydratase|uniref:tRNA A37 threonylcarbamoyladenosine dehydratase n=1 Tax=Paramaledivibacter caminithermalis (strain DSM 15212 / CIP 107654 / DViRD3) TaxID=1121301 RepID=A0A1M6LEY9_PARC5|nr:tRNA threonylcarbamoyladenosine dehydratase [Paramaledivibacter caminithermalis]SHJ69791.1 tRNA A37 threonylcarbamoyladenosine dehydratase [Paramaledivibacter caminithermalis DSM 15212]
MALHSFSRTELLIGKEGLDKLSNKTVAIFGIGGVGTFVVEGLARSGIGKFILVDDDDICLTNINRQIHALRSTVGRAKVEVMKERILDINPKAEVITHKILYTAQTAEKLLKNSYDYVVDAIDMVSSKLDLIERCYKKNIPIMSSMGAGNKLDPTRFEVDDIYNTSICPLAKVMRKELRKRGVERLKVVYSKEVPIKPMESTSNCKTDCICTNKERTCTVRRQIPGSVAFVPSVAGLIIASEVIKDLLKE